ncbi:anaerobic nitrite reductase HB2-like [Rutidosis leptorrhynchoides]|uniref:anaerobic nitrite reductase HB2-like n=1 Tax=Rutidosis leptorrhynchoides TaxID=125765 RepID=UPI003A99F1B7
MGFSEEQEALVKDSWEIVRHNISALSLYFFTQVLEMAPSAKGLFSFLKDTDEIPEDNPRVKSHAYIVFKMTCDAAIHLREKREVVISDFALKHLGSVHLQKGIVGPHFEVVKEAVLRTVEKGVGDKWSEEMKGAWTEAYDQLAAVIQNEMKKEATETHEIEKEPAAINS